MTPEAVYLPAIFLAASFTQGVSGFGTALVAMPFLTMFMKVQTAAPLCMLNGLIITGYLTLRLKRHIPWRRVAPLMTGTIPGIGIGIYFLKNFDSTALQVALGVFITAYAIHSLATRPKARPLSPAWGYLAGFLTGVIGSAFSAGGPPTIVYITMSEQDKDTIKATLSSFFFANGVITAAGHAISGLTTATVLHHLMFSAPATIAGVLFGSACYGKIKAATYIKVILYLLIAMGVMMVYGALGR